ncbi:hypothetical protein Tco_0438849, partial [Tanacetum coccineum]
VVSTQGMHRSTPRAHRTPTLTASTYGKKRKQTAGESSSLRKSYKITIRKKKQSTTPIPPPAQENIAKVQEKLDEEEIEKMVEGDEDEELYASEFVDSMLNDDFDDSGTRLEPGSHKENLEHVVVVDDDDDDEKKVDETKDAEMGSLETRTEEMQTPIPTPPRSLRIILSSDKNTTQELTDDVPLPTATTSSKRSISSKYSHLSGALRRMCRRQGYMIQNMERTCVTRKYFWKTHKKVDQVLHEVVPQLVERATEDLIENNLKLYIAAIVIEDRDAFCSEVPNLVSQEFNAQAPQIIEELFKNYVQNNVIQVHPTTTTSTEQISSADLQHQLYLKMKRSLQDQANDQALWEVLKRKFKKSFTSNTSCRDDDIHSHHDDHQEDDAPLVEETVIDEDEVIPEDETPELITKLQNVDKHVPTIFDYARMKATLNDALSNQFKNAEEYAYHLEQTTNFMENKIVWESRQEDIRHPVPRPLVFFGPQRNPNEPPSYLNNKDLFFLKHGNTKEKYILSLHKIHAERFPKADLEEKMNRWVRKEFKNFNENARLSIQHWKDSWHKRVYKKNQRRVRNNPEDYFSNHKFTEVVRITID